MRNPLLILLTFSLLLTVIAQAILHRTPGKSGSEEITLYRFFGGCSDEYADVTDISKAVGECGVIQVLTNRFNAENPFHARVITQTAEWSTYYNRLSAAYAANRPPDIIVMHRSVLADFLARGLLAPLSKGLSDAGVDFEDFVPSALQGVRSQGEIFALPFDLHGLLWHVNLGILSQAGLVSPDGHPIFPRSPEELNEHAKRVKLATGKNYLAIPSQTDPMPSWMFESWVWQQRAEFFSPDSRTATFETPSALIALRLLTSLYDQSFADPHLDYSGAEQSFLNGEAAILVNGTWVVDSYLAQSKKPEVRLKKYGAYTLPNLFQSPAVWTDSHVWVLPQTQSANPSRQKIALAFLAYLYQHNGAWGATGHLPVRKSVLKSQEFLSLPERAHYSSTAEIARSFPPLRNQRSIGEEIVQQINATWLAPRPSRESLLEAQSRIQSILNRTADQSASAR